jgi:hypothetical protein
MLGNKGLKKRIVPFPLLFSGDLLAVRVGGSVTTGLSKSNENEAKQTHAFRLDAQIDGSAGSHAALNGPRVRPLDCLLIGWAARRDDLGRQPVSTKYF